MSALSSVLIGAPAVNDAHLLGGEQQEGEHVVRRIEAGALGLGAVTGSRKRALDGAESSVDGLRLAMRMVSDDRSSAAKTMT